MSKKDFSETHNGKALHLKVKDLTDNFWSHTDVVERYHVYEDGDSEDSYRDVQ